MRLKNSINNTIVIFIVNLMTIIIGFIAQKIFINILGTEYLGINGLFTNIISMLGIVELGIGSAIVFNLYKPIANDDKETIKSLMHFYKKTYNLIAIIVLILGLIMMLFLPFFIKDITVDTNLNLIYFLFIIDIVCSYIMSYKRSILYANQKNYIVNIIHILYIIVLNASQLMLLYYTKNYYLYLIVKIIVRLLENITITLIANKKYAYLLDKNVKKLETTIEKDIFTKVKALFLHKVGGFFVQGTDNIIISKFIGINEVGYYSNYYLILHAIETLFGKAITALVPSVGNMLVAESNEKKYDVFKKIRFANFWIACFSGISILLIMDSFITIWIGKQYLLSKIVLIVLVFNFYQKMMRNSYSTFKEAAGIFYEDRYVPIIESILNIVTSIILIKPFGLAGIFMGTIISGLALWCYSYPKYVYKKIFYRSYLDYIKETIGYILLFILISILSVLISNLFAFNNIWPSFIKNVLVALIIPNLSIFIIFYKSDNFKYYKNIIFKIINRKSTN